MDTHICMAESLPYSPETITTLLISYNPIQNNKLVKREEYSGVLTHYLGASHLGVFIL